jgi:predicted ribosomally synthesized peptide with SipW-like signal peptide
MGTKTTLRMVAILGAATILALFTVQGTLAAWNQTDTSNRQIVTGADFSVAVKASGAANQQLSVSGQIVTIPGITGLLPGTSRTTAVTLTNSSNAGSGTFRIRVDPGLPTATGVLAPYLTTDLYRVQDTDCSVNRVAKAVELGQGQSGTLCLTVTLEANSPATLGGEVASVGFNLNTTQLQ